MKEEGALDCTKFDRFLEIQSVHGIVERLSDDLINLVKEEEAQHKAKEHSAKANNERVS